MKMPLQAKVIRSVDQRGGNMWACCPRAGAADQVTAWGGQTGRGSPVSARVGRAVTGSGMLVLVIQGESHLPVTQKTILIITRLSLPGKTIAMVSPYL